MPVDEGPTGGYYYDKSAMWDAVYRVTKSGTSRGRYENQQANTAVNQAVTKIGPVSGRYDPELAAFLSGELT